VSKLHTRARCVCALSIQRLEGSRPRLRRTRAPMGTALWETVPLGWQVGLPVTWVPVPWLGVRS